MTIVEKLAIGALVIIIYSVICVFGGYEWSQSRQVKQELKQETKAIENTQKLETANQVAAAPIIKEIEVIKWRVRTVTKEVPIVQTIEVPSPTRECPAAITSVDRVLIDSAARNTDPSSTPGADDTSYPAGPLTTSVVTNYGRCNVCITELSGLQDYVRRTLDNQHLLCPKP